MKNKHSKRVRTDGSSESESASESSDDEQALNSFDSADEAAQRRLMFQKLLKIEQSNEKWLGSLTDDVKDLKKKVATLEKENSELREEIEFVKQVNLSNSVVIYGVPKKKDTSDTSLVEAIAKKLDLNITESDLSETFRLGVKNSANSSTPPLVVKFVRNSVRTSFISAKNKKNLKTTDIGLQGESKRIYLNEYLTRNNNDLLKYAKQLKEKDFKYVWPAGGKVFAKKQEGDKAIVIRNKLMVDELLEKNK